MRIGHIVVDHLGVAGQMGEFSAEDLVDLLGMLVVLGKNDGLAKLFTVIDAQTVVHQHVQDLTDGILVKHPFVERRGCDQLRKFTVFVLKGVLVGLLIGFGKVVIHDALLDKFELAFHRDKIHKKAVLDRLRQLVAVGRYAVFKLENLIRVLVDLILRCGGKTNQGRVKIVENIPVFVVNGAVRLVYDNKIKVTDRKELLLILVLHGIDAVHHRLISGEHATRVKILLILAEIGYREVGQHIDKAALCL